MAIHKFTYLCTILCYVVHDNFGTYILRWHSFMRCGVNSNHFQQLCRSVVGPAAELLGRHGGV